VFMVRVSKPKEIFIWVLEILDRKNGEPYLNRNIWVIEIRISDNFGSGFQLPNNPLFLKYLFLLCLIVVLYP